MVGHPSHLGTLPMDSAAMLETVLFAKLRFHDTTSRGRLLNRFGKDIEKLDSDMANYCELDCPVASTPLMDV